MKDEEEGTTTDEGTAKLQALEFVPTDSGKDPLKPDVAIYARRIGLESETFLVQTDDGFILELWHLYNPLTSKGHSKHDRAIQVSTPLSQLPNARRMTPHCAHLKPNGPNMWTWDVRHMATRDLPALISRVCEVTELEKVGLIAHSQGTTKTLISLS